jgi:hypothetical protein
VAIAVTVDFRGTLVVCVWWLFDNVSRRALLCCAAKRLFDLSQKRRTLFLLLVAAVLADGLLTLKMKRRLPQNLRQSLRHTPGKPLGTGGTLTHRNPAKPLSSLRSIIAKGLPDDPLFGGSAEAAYFVELDVGTPPQTLRMDPDTGSSNFVAVTPECGCSYYGSGEREVFLFVIF